MDENKYADGYVDEDSKDYDREAEYAAHAAMVRKFWIGHNLDGIVFVCLAGLHHQMAYVNDSKTLEIFSRFAADLMRGNNEIREHLGIPFEPNTDDEKLFENNGVPC